MRRLDDLLLDRAFQPFCDALSGRATCFDLARSTALGTGILCAGSFLAREPDAVGVVGILLWLALGVGLRAAVGRVERQARDAAPCANLQRLDNYPVRLVHLTFIAWLLFAMWQAGVDPGRVLFAAGEMMQAATFYLMACNLSPPKRQARAPHLATVAAR